MTVVAAVASGGQVVMAADHASYKGGRKFPSQPKIVRFGTGPDDGAHVLLASAGAAELLPYLVQTGRLQVKPPGRNLEAWAQGVAEDVTRIAAGMTPSLVTDTGEHTDDDDRGRLLADLLLGHAGRLWCLDANLASLMPDGVQAVGSGSEVAMGYLVAALEAGRSPRDAARGAVEAACRLTDSCALFGAGPLVEELNHL